MSEYIRVQPDAYREDFVCWASDSSDDYPYDHDHAGDCDYGWSCNQPGCFNRTDIYPCSDHAPSSAPGLRLVKCQATPRHWLFVHDRDDYGHGCPWCWHERAVAELKPLKMAAERRSHRWCWLLNPLKRLAIRLRVAQIRGYSGNHACWHTEVRWRWSVIDDDL